MFQLPAAARWTGVALTLLAVAWLAPRVAEPSPPAPQEPDTVSGVERPDIVGEAQRPGTASDRRVAESGATEPDPGFGPEVGAFGFAPGEERRYELGPARLLHRGRRVTWRARLDRFEAAGSEVLAIFALQHEDEVAALGPVEHQLDWVRSEGEVAVNRHGFPRWLEFTEQDGVSSRVHPFLGAVRWTRYEFDGEGRFEKLSRVEGKEWSVELPIARHGGLDLDVPRGLWILASSGEGFFTNPAFVDVMLLRPVARSPERQQVLLFEPTGTDRFWDPFEARNGRRVLRDFYAHGHVERRGRERVQVGERRVDAWRIELGGVARTAWVDSGGRVVRLDLSDNPLVDAVVRVRLVPASEY